MLIIQHPNRKGASPDYIEKAGSGVQSFRANDPWGRRPQTPCEGPSRLPSPPLRKVLRVPVFDQRGGKGGVGTLLRRLKQHFAFFTESDF